MPVAGFADIRFGFSAAETEGAEEPDLLLHGFFDHSQLTEKALRGLPFLFLGYKGSGKTALAERAALLARDEPNLFVQHTWLNEFSFLDFRAAAGGGGDAQTRYPTVWAWLLLCKLIESLQRDEGGFATPEYTAMVRGLKTLGLLPMPSLGELVTTSSKRAFKGSIPKFFEYSEERIAATQDLALRQLVAAVRAGVESFDTESRHIVFIDGLDSLFTQRELQFQSLAALITEAAALNSSFKRSHRPFKFVVLCRTDIFDRLPGANINKLRQDHSMTLDWYDDPKNPDRTRLIRLGNLRARLSLRREVKVVEEFLPAKAMGRPIHKVILDHTRHTPRDFVQVLRHLQDFAPVEGPLSENAVLSGLRKYSIDYFLPEMRNELSGYFDQPQIDQAVSLLNGLRRQRVRHNDLYTLAVELGLNSLDIDALTRSLFDASCIGTYERRPGKQPIHTIKYRNRHATLVRSQDIWLHPAMLKALNIERNGNGHRPDGMPRRRRRGRPSRPPEPGGDQTDHTANEPPPPGADASNA